MDRSTTFYARTGKRMLDLAIAIPALLLCSPLMAIIAVLIDLTLGRPILFRQRRPGQHEKIFTILKFRTMTNARDRQGNLLPDTQRLVPLGRLLRKTSIDELPQLWNVLRGDMSLVGPRPLLIQYLDHYTERERKRHLVRPGITGLAQVAGRNYLSWEQRFALDVQYVERLSFMLDLRLLLQTLVKVLKRSDVGEGWMVELDVMRTG